MADDNAQVGISAQEIDEVVSQFRLFNRRLSYQQIQRLFNELPKMTEADLFASGHQDDVCPICFNTFVAILAEEELAHAMDSPAHPIDELGVTRLQKTCGHIFCRKDIMKWTTAGHDSCPSCRQPMLAAEDRRGSGVVSQSGENWLLRPWTIDSSMLPQADAIHALGVADSSRHQFTGMYS